MLRYILFAFSFFMFGFITVLNTPWAGADGHTIPEYMLSGIEYLAVAVSIAILGTVLRLSIKKNAEINNAFATMEWSLMKIFTIIFSTLLLMAAPYVAGVGVTVMMIRQDHIIWPAILYQRPIWYQAAAVVTLISGLVLWYWEKRHSEPETQSVIRHLWPWRKKVSTIN